MLAIKDRQIESLSE
jgi:hypothetical protein